MRRRSLLTNAALAAAGAPGPRWALAAAPVPPVLTRVSTALGDLVIAVDPARAPITVANYLAYVDGRILDGGSVYRIVTPDNQGANTRYKIEVVQWGLNAPDDRPSPLPPIRHESTRETGLRHLDGTLSMARNAPGSASSEFFVCIGDQPELDFGGHRNPDGQGFAAFGQVVAGKATLARLYARAEPVQFLKQPIAIRSVWRVAEADRDAALALP